MTRDIQLTILEDQAGVCRLPPRSEFPGWAVGGDFSSITHTADEWSVICPQKNIPAGVTCETGWRVIKMEGPFEFTEIGILEKILHPLADAGISILAVSTFDTDYVLVKSDQLPAALAALEAAGIHFTQPSSV